MDASAQASGSFNVALVVMHSRFIHTAEDAASLIVDNSIATGKPIDFGLEEEEGSLSGASQALWCAPMPLVLASRSEARQALLRNAGIPFEPVPVAIDERGLEARLLACNAGPAERAIALARSKAEAASKQHPGRMVVGADQILVAGTESLHKPADREAAARHLRLLSGKSHVLHAGVAVVMDGETTFFASQSACMTMRELSASFIERYLDCVGEAASASVGAYAVEGLGIQLFSAIEGDHSTILGLPMLPLLGYLREQGSLLA